MEYQTLTRDDPSFESYLLGTFSTTHRALPVETYHPQTKRERVTFHVVPLEKLKVPAWWKVYLRSSRPELLGLTLGPAIAAWLCNLESLADWTKWPSWFALLGLFFLHTSVFLFNDVQDHIRGFDRQNRRRGSQVIQKGWVRATDMRRWAWMNMFLAAAFGVPAFLNAPLGLSVVLLFAGLALLMILTRLGVRYGLSDLSLWLLFGPLLTCGIALASFGIVGTPEFILGSVLGALTLWVFQVRHFENLFRARPESAHTILGYMSFDRVRTVCLIEGGLLLGAQPLVALYLGLPFVVIALAALVGIPMVLTMQRFIGAASPLSSKLTGSSHLALFSHLTWTMWWVIGLSTTWLLI